MAMSVSFAFVVAMMTLREINNIYCFEIEPKCSKFDFEEKLLEKMVRLEHFSSVIMEQFRELSMQVKNDIASSKEELTATRHQIEEDQRNSSSAVMNQIKEFTETMNNNLENIKRRETQGAYKHRSSYAFNAMWVKDESPSPGDTLIFTRTSLNENNVYNSNTGEYTAPVNGTYMFSTTLCNTSGRWVKIKFVADESVIGVFFGGHLDDYYCTSTSTVGYLKKGMKVRIVVQATGGGDVFHQYNNDRMCSFSGHLIN